MKIKCLIILFIATINLSAHAQLYIEADPFAYGLKGHSLHLGIQGAGFRFQVGTFNAQYPDSFKDNEEFDVSQGGYGAKLDYYGKDPNGAFIGIEYGSTVANYQLKSGGEKVEQKIRLLGLRTGYKMLLGKSFYIMPWIGIDKNISENSDIEINDQVYKIQEIVVFPTVHIGIQF